MGHTFPSMVTVISNMCVLRVTLLAVFSRMFHTIESLGACFPITWATCAASFVVLFLIIVKRKILRQEPGKAKLA